ncbi:MAG: acyl-CoA desaturase [Actinomycetota bacterium]|nr:acyl-CoA desaturase [Actinomycetota bacterium]
MSTSEPVKGVIWLQPRQVRAQRATILALTVAPLLGLVIAIATLWGRGITPLDLGLLGAGYVVCGLGVTVGYHRLLTHRSFDVPRWLRNLFAILGSLAVEGSVMSWVADHRRHHAYADKPGDPHSPHLTEGEGIGATLKGLGHAHVGWLFSEERTQIDRWAPDLYNDPHMRRIDRFFPLLALCSLLVPAVVAGAVTGSFSGAVGGFLWGGVVRMLLLHHVTWSVNSICHFFGTRPFDTSDESTNNWPLALISFGESWHNNHHAFPTSAVHGLGRFQPDASGFVIRALGRMGLADNVKLPDDKRIISKRR